jgi:hypothetical protein
MTTQDVWSSEERIATVDVWMLRELRWPIIRLFARRFVEERELGRYIRELLASGRWRAIRVVPRAGGQDSRPHVFDVYGQPAEAE